MEKSIDDKQDFVLVTGGAGYIGSHVVHQLVAKNFAVIVIDNLYSGHRWAVHKKAQFIEGDCGDKVLLDSVLKRYPITAVMHFAGHIVVPESIADPLKYYRNNCLVSQSLIEACVHHHVDRFIFSSSAAVYGNPLQIPVTESAPATPISPYGNTKLITELLLRDVATSTNVHPPLRYVALRYFNVAGAQPGGEIGQATPQATHLIKVACQTALGLRENLQIYGEDYDTEDGTCIRDYIHVEDLASAHLAALAYLQEGGSSQVLNCGYGSGFSVKQVVDVVCRINGRSFPVLIGARREGDPAVLIADNTRIFEVLEWTPKFNDIRQICQSALDWERKQHQMEFAK